MKPSFVITVWVAFLLFSGCQSEIKSNKKPLVGALKSHSGVDNFGDGFYTIPIEVPPGTNKMQPKLSLSYINLPANDIVGVGWQLIGLSKISRVASTEAQDGFWAAVDYSSTDQYALDGKRLIQLKSLSNQDSTVFHTEIESWTHVIAYGNRSSGFTSFKIYEKGGRIRYYNFNVTTPDQKHTREWLLSKESDRLGNSISYQYEMDMPNGTAYLQDIAYTKNKGIKNYRKVAFHYESRPDTVWQYQGGHGFRYTKRLNAITTSVDGDVITQYNLSFNTSLATGRSQLSGINQCDAEGSCLPATEFHWQGQNQNLLHPVKSLANQQAFTSNGVSLPMDFNGDGLMDLLHAWRDPNSNNLTYATYTGDRDDGITFSGSINATSILFTGDGNPPLFGQDVNADGLSDLVYYFVDRHSNMLHTTIMLSNGSGFEKPIPSSTQIYTVDNNIFNNLKTGDFNGDGKSDFLICSHNEDNTLSYQVAYSNGQSFQAGKKVKTSLFALEDINLNTGNINGDPKMDLIYSYPWEGDSIVVTTLISSSDTFRTNSPLVSIPVHNKANYRVIPSDFNGDRLTDVTLSWLDGDTIVFSNLVSNGSFFTRVGHQFKQQSINNQESNILPLDLNGDSKMDFVYSSNVGGKLAVTPFISDGFQHNVDSIIHTNIDFELFKLLPVDINGDAKTDLLNIGTGSAVDSTQVDFVLAELTFPDLMIDAIDGIGGSVHFDYQPLTDPSVYEKQPVESTNFGSNNLFNQVNGAVFSTPSSNRVINSGSSFPVISEVIPTYVVASREIDNGRGQSHKLHYKYAGGKYDLSGRGWLGVETKAIIDTTANTVHQMHFKQEFPFTQQMDSLTTSRLSDHALMNRMILIYDSMRQEKYSDQVYQVLLKQQQHDAYTYGTFNYTNLKKHQYDDYGNVLKLSDYGDIAKPEYQLFTSYDYWYDESNWQLGLPTQKKEASDSLFQNVLTWKKISNYDSTTFLPKEVHDSVSTANWVRSLKQYDDYGNIIQTINHSKDTTTYIFDDRFYTFNTQVIHPPNGLGHKLSESHTYNAGFGQKISSTDPNENTISKVLDGVGRSIASLGPNPLTGKQDTLSKTTFLFSPDTLAGYGVQTYKRLNWDDDHWYWEIIYFDGQHKKYRHQAVGETSEKVIYQDWAYDNLGRVIRESLPYFRGTSPDSIRWSYKSYDANNRIIKSVAPLEDSDSTVTLLSYPDVYTTNQVIAANSPDAMQKTIVAAMIEGKEQVVQMIDAQKDTTLYNFDPIGRLIYTRDPIGVENSIQYNGIGLKTNFTETSLGKTNYTYDFNNRTHTEIYANGDSIVSYFDQLNRLIQEKTSDGLYYSYIYDLSDHKNGLGELCQVKLSDDTVYNYGYDAYGRKSIESLTAGQNTYHSLTSYAPLGHPVQLVYPDSSVVNYEYTLNGQLKKIFGTSGSDTTHFAHYMDYNAYNQSGQINYGNGVKQAMNFYRNGLLEKSQLWDIQSNSLFDENYRFNHRFHIDTVKVNGGKTTNRYYEYDALAHLTSATISDSTFLFSYDKGSNIIQKGNIQIHYQGHQSQYGVSGTDTTFRASYNARGSLTRKQKGNNRYVHSYDAHARLTSLHKNDTLVGKYQYDHTGTRIYKKNLITQQTEFYIRPDFIITQKADSLPSYTRYIAGHTGFIAAITLKGDFLQSPKVIGLDDRVKELQEGETGTMWIDWPAIPPSLWAPYLIWGMILFLNLLFLYHFIRWWHVHPCRLKPSPVLFFAATLLLWVAAPQPVAANNAKGSTTDQQVLYFHHDHLNSTRMVTDADGSLQTQVNYLPYGEILDLNGSDNFIHKFGGKQKDNESGLYYFNARYYDGDIGQFITADTQLGAHALQTGSFNRYLYTLGNPTNHVDPSGHSVTNIILQVVNGLSTVIQGVFFSMNVSKSLTKKLMLLEKLSTAAEGLSIVAGILSIVFEIISISSNNEKDENIANISSTISILFGQLALVGEVKIAKILKEDNARLKGHVNELQTNIQETKQKITNIHARSRRSGAIGNELIQLPKKRNIRFPMRLGGNLESEDINSSLSEVNLEQSQTKINITNEQVVNQRLSLFQNDSKVELTK